MKKIILILPLFYLLACQNSPTESTPEIKEANLSGAIDNPRGKEVTLYLQGEKILIPVDDTGKFTTKIPVESPMMLQMVHGGERTTIYVQPGYDLAVQFNTAEFDETINYSGKGAAENNYLASKFLLDEQLMTNWRDLFGLETNEFLAKIEDMQQKHKDNFKSAMSQNSDMSDDFVAIEKQNIQIVSANNRLMYPSYYAYAKNVEEPVMPEGYYDFLKNFEFNDERMLASQDFKNFIDAYLARKAKQQVGEDAENFAAASAQIKLIDQFSTSPKIKDYAYYTMLGGLLSEYGADFPSDILATFKANCKDEEMVSKVMEEYNQWAKLAKGEKAPSWKYENTKGEMVALEDLRGKVVYIDVWATWCGPCKAELPYLEKLVEQYEDGGKIAFTSISIDENKDAWEKMVKEKEMKGIQLFADKAWKSSICEDNLIKGIPRFMLIDAEGKIINVNAPRPSSKEINKILADIQSGNTLLSVK